MLNTIIILQFLSYWNKDKKQQQTEEVKNETTGEPKRPTSKERRPKRE